MKGFKVTRRWVMFMVLLLCFGSLAYAQRNVAVRNNLIYDLTGTPNLGVDVRVSPHWTLGLTGGYRPWPTDDKKERKWRHLLIAPELRWWPDSTFHKGYWGTNLIYSHYNVGNVKFPLGLYKDVRDHRVEGDLFAIGLFYGRSWRISRYFRMEGELGAALGYAWFKKYDCTHCGTYYGKDNKLFFIPKLTLNIVYQKVEKKPVEPIITPIDTTPPPPPVLAFHLMEENTGRAGMLQKDNPVLAHISNIVPTTAHAFCARRKVPSTSTSRWIRAHSSMTSATMPRRSTASSASPVRSWPTPPVPSAASRLSDLPPSRVA